MIATSGGLRSWLARRVEVLSISWTLRWLEQDIDTLDAYLCAGPELLATKRADAEVLRVRLALLQD